MPVGLHCMSRRMNRSEACTSGREVLVHFPKTFGSAHTNGRRNKPRRSILIAHPIPVNTRRKKKIFVGWPKLTSNKHQTALPLS